MNNKIIAVLICLSGFLASAQKSKEIPSKKMNQPSIYSQQFEIETLSGDAFDLQSLKGKKVMIVNTASKCGLTPQYEQLEALYKRYKDQGFVIIGFPANNFAAQEPGTNAQIAEFCKLNYGVTFPMMAKISVKGDDKAPIYEFLTNKAKNGVQDSEVEWNFQKYLLDENGRLVKVVSPQTLPTDESIVKWIVSK